MKIDETRSSNGYEYQVVTCKSAKWTGALDAEQMERVLNEHAADGWRLSEGFSAQSVWKSGSVEIVFVFEREHRA